MDPQTLKALRSYADVAHRLGLLLSQWHGGAIAKCELQFNGEIADRDTRLLTSAFCAGLIENHAEDANVINAELLCQERGIEVVRTSNSGPGTFSSIISATVSGDGKSHNASGTVFGKDMPRLVKLGEYRTEAYMDGNLLIFTHRDVPGIIGYVGNVLAEDKVNIAQMAVGRESDAGGPAIGVLNLDATAPESAITKIVENDGIESSKQIALPPAGELPDWLG